MVCVGRCGLVPESMPETRGRDQTCGQFWTFDRDTYIKVQLISEVQMHGVHHNYAIVFPSIDLVLASFS